MNPVMPVAFVVGVGNALLFRRTGSVWPGVFGHGVNNGLASLAAVLAGVWPVGLLLRSGAGGR